MKMIPRFVSQEGSFDMDDLALKSEFVGKLAESKAAFAWFKGRKADLLK